MEPTERSQDEWGDSRPGDVHRLVQGLKARKRAHAIERKAALTAAVLLIGLTGAWLGGAFSSSGPQYAGLYCSEVLELAPEFMADRLDVALVEKIEKHLTHCTSCKNRIDDMRNGKSPDASSKSSTPAACLPGGKVARQKLASNRPVVVTSL